jgi:methyl coenzyme M reductase subunit D
MKYVEIKAVEVNNSSSDRLEDSVLLAVDETKTKVEEVPSVLRKIIKKKYNVREFGEEFKKDQILFGKEMDEIDEELLNEYGLYTVTIQEIKVNWDDGMTL